MKTLQAEQKTDAAAEKKSLSPVLPTGAPAANCPKRGGSSQLVTGAGERRGPLARYFLEFVTATEDQVRRDVEKDYNANVT